MKKGNSERQERNSNFSKLLFLPVSSIDVCWKKDGATFQVEAEKNSVAARSSADCPLLFLFRNLSINATVRYVTTLRCGSVRRPLFGLRLRSWAPDQLGFARAVSCWLFCDGYLLRILLDVVSAFGLHSPPTASNSVATSADVSGALVTNDRGSSRGAYNDQSSY